MALPRRDRRDKLKEFFEDGRGIYSMVRLGYFLNLGASLFIAIFCTLKGQPGQATELILVMNGIGTVGKVAQKQVEESNGNTIRDNTGGLGPVGDDYPSQRLQ